MVSSHCDFKKDFERKAGEAGEIGLKYLIAPYLGAQKTLDDYKKFAERSINAETSARRTD